MPLTSQSHQPVRPPPGLLRETGLPVTREQTSRLRQHHAGAYAKPVGQVRPLPGARELLAAARRLGAPIETSSSSWKTTSMKS
jgi:beta-phosphoglucomutase-like phosphatase (HAD superfamily)